LASLEAITKIGKNTPDSISIVLKTLKKGLSDPDGLVRKSSLEGIASFADQMGDNMKSSYICNMMKLVNDKNQLVSQAATSLLQNVFKTKTPDQKPVFLNAGPIKVLFKEGELRYIFAGNKEIIRRIYFAVRDSNWGTVMPVFEKYDIQKTDNSFKIKLKARCLSDQADYSWNGEIEGTSDGTISFSVTGKPDINFKSCRIGTCVLYGAESLSRQYFTVVNDKNQKKELQFPEWIDTKLVADNYSSLKYKTDDGIEVMTDISGDGLFKMEDQRIYGDASYKAYMTMYPDNYLQKDQSGSQVFTVHVKCPKSIPEAPQKIVLRVGKNNSSNAFPKISSYDQKSTFVWISSLLERKDKLKDNDLIRLSYNPVVHLPDEDMRMENIPVVVMQTKTMRSFVPNAQFILNPVIFASPEFPSPEMQAAGSFTDAWCARMIKYAAIAGIKEIAFGVPSLNLSVLKDLEGKILTYVDIYGYGYMPVDAFAVKGNGFTTLWIINITDQNQSVFLEDNTTISLDAYEVRVIEMK
jgi:hypothetical protein